MMRFSERLKEVLVAEKWNQKQLAERIGVDSSNVSRWDRGVALPDKEALEKLIRVISPEHASLLLAAWVAESLPPSAGELLVVQPRHLSSKVADAPKDELPAELSTKTKKMFSDFARLAIENKDVMEIVKILHTAATRVRKLKK